eukprot:SAG11_NODE_45_length_20574_cov_8.004054_3_plen_412_part_00
MLQARRDKMISLIDDRMRKAVQMASDKVSVSELDSIFHDSLPIVHELDESLWNAMREHRDLAVKRLRTRIRQALSDETDFDVVEQLLEEASACKHEMPEEWNELHEHRAYLLEEVDFTVLSSQALLQRSEVEDGGYTPGDFALVAAKVAQLESFGMHTGNEELERLRKIKVSLLAQAQREMAALLTASDSAFDPGKAISAAQTYGAHASHSAEVTAQLNALTVKISRHRELVHAEFNTLFEKVAAGRAEPIVGAGGERYVDAVTPVTIDELLRRSSSYAADGAGGVVIMADRRRAEDLKSQLVEGAMHALGAIVRAPTCDVEAAQLTLERYRGYGEETKKLWEKTSARLADELSKSRGLILEALGCNDLHAVQAVRLRHGLRGAAARTTLGPDLEMLETHYREQTVAQLIY